jgi:tetratricopeptide (TPR) repeat protein
MFRQVRFQCDTCGEGFVDWHDEDWERAPVFCVNCGESIVAGEPIEQPRTTPQQSRAETASESALGVLKGAGLAFRDTLPGLRSAPPPAESLSDEPPESSSEAQTGARRSAARGSSRAASEAPRASAALWTARHPRLAPLSAMLIGFAVGIPFALLTADPIVDFFYPARAVRSKQSEQFAAVSTAIDKGKLELAHQLLDRITARPGDTDQRATTLRARLALAFILANRPSDAGREIAVVAQQPQAMPPVADLRRVFGAVFPPESRPATAAAPATSAAATPPKPTVSKRELLTFARDRQHRAQLDLAERLYSEVLRVHPNDAEARCGLAEVQLLRGGVADGARLFARALDDNPGYAPAWIGLADTDWLSGHPERAACRYQAVIDRFPNGSYPPYITQRVAQVSNSGAIVQAARSNGSAATACGD